jgi:hypothetical protein
MQGVYFINERISLYDLSREESFKLQERTLKNFINENQIRSVKLNPYQIYSHYTILQALLYDLKKSNVQLDCFIYYSNEVVDDFIYIYPDLWILIMSFFNNVIPVHKEPFLLSIFRESPIIKQD